MKPRKFPPGDCWDGVSDWLKARGKLSWSIGGYYYVRDLDSKNVQKMRRRKFIRFVDAMRMDEGLLPFLPDSKPVSKSASPPE
tara:strand:+ start:259 stop:507 length:249 start_codon:yes stop_codon:yes gene_type:complete